MAWTTAGSISLKTDWQYTEPIEGSYFKLKHSSFPINNSYLIAQAQVNSDGSIELADITELKASSEADVLRLKTPPVFSDRRIAIKRVQKQPDLASELRRVIRNDLLEDADIEFRGRRSAWMVEISSSDYVEPAVQASSGSTPATTSKTLTYVSDGDANGVFYWLGTHRGIDAWSNPHTAGQVVLEAQIGGGILASLVDRQASNFNTDNIANNAISVDLGAENKLIPNSYSLRSRSEGSNSYLIRNWKIQGSNDKLNWTTLDTQTDNSSVTVDNQWLSLPITDSPTAYRYLRMQTTGLNSSGNYAICIGEWEFYGTLNTTT